MKEDRNKLPYFDRIIRSFVVSRDGDWMQSPIKTQEKILQNFLRSNAETVFGKKYSVQDIQTYADFRSSVPVSSYEDIFPYIERMQKGEHAVLTHTVVREYAKSSGTANGRSKFIPTPSEYMANNHLKACRHMIEAYARTHPDTKIFSGKAITIAGSMSPIPGSDALAGDVSALMTRAVPWWTACAKPYSKSLSLHPSWSYKAEKIASATVGAHVVSLFGTPTWMLEILEIVKTKSGAATLGALWKDIEVFFHGAVSFAPYRKTFESLIAKPNMEFREVYNASEGVFAFEDDTINHSGELLLCTDHDIFYEFIPIVDCVPKGEAVSITDVVPDVQYAMLITTGGGLWRYLIGDIIIFTSVAPYRIKIVGRTTQYINAFGEEVIADNAIRALDEAARATGAEVQQFTASPTFEAAPAQGAHEWVIEFRTAPLDIEAFAVSLDSALRALNSDYDAKRTGDIILAKPVVHVAPSGTFRAYLEEKGKLGGQNKVPLLSGDRKILEEVLKRFV